MLKNKFVRTIVFTVLYLGISLALSWLFDTTIVIKQFLANALIASFVFYLLAQDDVVKMAPVLPDKDFYETAQPVAYEGAEAPVRTTVAKKPAKKAQKHKAKTTATLSGEKKSAETTKTTITNANADPLMFEPAVPNVDTAKK